MINNPLSQDEGVKFVFIHISTAFTHKSMLMSCYPSPRKQCYTIPIIIIFLPHVLYHLKPDGLYSMLCMDSVVESQWSITGEGHCQEEAPGVCKSWRSERRARSWGLNCPPRVAGGSGRLRRASLPDKGREGFTWKDQVTRRKATVCSESVNKFLKITKKIRPTRSNYYLRGIDCVTSSVAALIPISMLTDFFFSLSST